MQMTLLLQPDKSNPLLHLADSVRNAGIPVPVLSLLPYILGKRNSRTGILSFHALK